MTEGQTLTTLNVQEETKGATVFSWADMLDDGDSISSNQDNTEPIIGDTPEGKENIMLTPARQDPWTPGPPTGGLLADSGDQGKTAAASSSSSNKNKSSHPGSWADRVRGPHATATNVTPLKLTLTPPSASKQGIEDVDIVAPAHTETEAERDVYVEQGEATEATVHTSTTVTQRLTTTAGTTKTTKSTFVKRNAGSWAECVRGPQVSTSTDVAPPSSSTQGVESLDAVPVADVETDVQCGKATETITPIATLIPTTLCMTSTTTTTKSTVAKRKAGSWAQCVRGPQVSSTDVAPLSSTPPSTSTQGVENLDAAPVADAEHGEASLTDAPPNATPTPQCMTTTTSTTTNKKSTVVKRKAGSWAECVRGPQVSSTDVASLASTPLSTSTEDVEDLDAATAAGKQCVEETVVGAPKTAPAATATTATKSTLINHNSGSWVDHVRPANDQPHSAVSAAKTAPNPASTLKQGSHNTVILWIGSLRVPEKHSEHWLMRVFAPYQVVKVVEMGAGYALCEFPTTMVSLVFADFHKVKVDGKKFEVKFSKKYPPVRAA